MIQYQCLALSTEANVQAKVKSAQSEGFGRMGFRFESRGVGKHSFEPIVDLRVKDYVLQPVLGGVIIFVDPDSLAKGYGTDIHFDGKNFVFTQSERTMPKIADKTEQKKSEEKARRAAARASKDMKPGADKARVVRAVKEASLAADEVNATKKKAVVAKKVATTMVKTSANIDETVALKTNTDDSAIKKIKQTPAKRLGTLVK